MPAPAAVYVLAVVGTIGAVYAFRHFVYEPHLAPKLEQIAEEFIARRRASRRQQQGPIPVPVDIPLHRRRRSSRSRHSDSTSDSDSNSDERESRLSNKNKQRGFSVPSGRTTARGPDFNESLAHEVGEWRAEVGRSQTNGSLRHRTNIAAHAMDESINPIPHPTMSPMHVLIDTSAPTTPTTTTVPSRLSSPPVQVSPLLPIAAESTLQSSPSSATVLLRPSPLSQSHTPHSTIPRATASTSTATSPVLPSANAPGADCYSPPSFSSPIPSLSQSYPQELDRERGVELLSPPSSGTSSPFTTFSPLVAPQVLSPFAEIQPLDRNPSPEAHPWSPNPVAQMSFPSQDTLTDTAGTNFQSLPTSPTPTASDLSSPVNVPREQLHSPSHEGESRHFMPTPISFTSPNALSPRSPHTDLSELDFESDIEVISEHGSEGSDHSWAALSSASGFSGRR